MPHYIFEARVLKTMAGPIAGVDEAGRGPLAGPVVAAAVILNRKRIPKGLNDSKQMTADAREEAFARIMECAVPQYWVQRTGYLPGATASNHSVV